MAEALPSSPAWAAEREVTATWARSVLEAAWPELRGRSVVAFGEGWDNAAFLVGEELVFRFPRRAAAVAGLRCEAAVLPLLDLPIATPRPTHVLHDDGHLGWPVVGYPMLRGTTLCRAPSCDASAQHALAIALGHALRALHALPRPDAAPNDVIGRLELGARRSLAESRLQRLATRGWRVPAGLLGTLEAAQGLRPVASALCHGDLYARHVLVDAGHRPCGLIDWGDLHWGDAAVDLAGVLEILPPECLPTFERTYGPVSHAHWCLARGRAVAHACAVADYAVSIGDGDLTDAARRSLTWLAGALTRPHGAT